MPKDSFFTFGQKFFHSLYAAFNMYLSFRSSLGIYDANSLATFCNNILFPGVSVNFLKIYFIEIKLIYSIVFTSAVEHNDSIIHIHTFFYYSFP